MSLQLSKPNPLSCNIIVQLLAAAVVFQDGKHLGIIAVEDAVDGVLADDVLNLASAEVKMLGQGGGITFGQLGNHLLPSHGNQHDWGLRPYRWQK